jgi:paraquat-inducible protein A
MPIDSKPYRLFILLLISIVLYYLGVTLPIFTSTKFFIFEEKISLIKSIKLLYENNDYFLAGIILLFTILFPISKYIFMTLILLTKDINMRKYVNNKLKKLGKWSMVDVFVISLLVVIIKLGKGFFTIKMNAGTIFFAMSVITSIIVNSMIEKYYVHERIKEKDHSNKFL